MSNDLESKFDECFKRQFPATFEAAQKWEPKQHMDFSIAWWGFREGYRCALPTTEPQRPKAISQVPYFLALSVASFIAGYIFGGGLFS